MKEAFRASNSRIFQAKGTVALIGIASGEVAPGGAATATRPGVNELRVDQGSQGNVIGLTSDRYGLPLKRNEQDAERIRALGAPADRVQVNGNLKYDLELPAPSPLSTWLEEEARRLGRSPIQSRAGLAP